jgi:hypothetical protein
MKTVFASILGLGLLAAPVAAMAQEDPGYQQMLLQQQLNQQVEEQTQQLQEDNPDADVEVQGEATIYEEAPSAPSYSYCTYDGCN